MHAYLVTAHQRSAHLDRLIERLGRSGAVYLHVDASADISDFSGLDAVVVDERVKVVYPNFSLVMASLLPARAALRDGATRLTLLRQNHYPLVSDTRLMTLAHDLTSDIIAAYDAPDPSRGKPVTRFTRRAVASNNFDSPWYKVESGIYNRALGPLDWGEALGERKLKAGSAYWSLSAPTMQAILDDFDRGGAHIDYFKAIASAAECYPQTMAAFFSSNLVVDTISFSVWAGGQHPEALTQAALEKVVGTSNYLFAKKFSDQQSTLVDWVESQSMDDR